MLLVPHKLHFQALWCVLSFGSMLRNVAFFAKDLETEEDPSYTFKTT